MLRWIVRSIICYIVATYTDTHSINLSIHQRVYALAVYKTVIYTFEYVGLRFVETLNKYMLSVLLSSRW